MSYSLDVNLLLYASDSSSPHHAKAKAFVESCLVRPDVLYLAWPTVMGYLRMATHPSIFDQPLAPEEAMANIEAFLNLAHARCLSEEDGFWDVYRTTTRDAPARGNQVPDAHLASLLRHHGVRTLYTHDRDFLRFDFLEVRDPLA